MTNEESLRLITEMINKAKSTINENGTSSILWGAVVGFCGLTTFAQAFWHFSIGFDVWILALVAIVPQIVISIKEGKRNLVKTHTQIALDAVWIVYSISIFALIFYMNIAAIQETKYMASQGLVMVQKNIASGELKPDGNYPPSSFSLFLLIYAMPTMITGIVTKFKPMIVGALLCYAFFAVSLFTPWIWDALLSGLAGIFNWLIPGILLRRRFLSQARTSHV